MTLNPVLQPPPCPVCLLTLQVVGGSSPSRCPDYLSLLLLPVWMNVSLTPWLLDFHANGSCGWFFVFKLVVILLLVVGKKQSVSACASTLASGSIFQRFYLFIFREGKGRRKRGRETSICGCPLNVPHWGPGPQPTHVPSLGLNW